MVLLSVVLLLSAGGGFQAAWAQPPSGGLITAVEWQQTRDAFVVTVSHETSPTYTIYELFSPLRVIVDIADARLADSALLPLKPDSGPVAEITGSRIDGQDPPITRIELVLSEDRLYSAEKVGNNIVLKFPTAATASDEPAGRKHLTAEVAPRSAGSVATRASRASLLQDVVVTAAPGQTRVLLQAEGPIEKYRRARLPADQGQPHRLYLDLPDFRMTGNYKQVPVGSALARIRLAHRDNGLRAVFDSGLDQPFEYDIQPDPRGLLITIFESPLEAGMLAELVGRGPLAALPESDQAGREKIEPVLKPASFEASPAAIPSRPEKPTPLVPARKAQPAGIPSNGGPGPESDLQKISVDFFKIDLHNVFRLIGEISGRNIVVDESVSGTLTLALSDVPWDFVLNVILNLKDLQKEERYNTIVISPKSKEFQWPQLAMEQLAVRADGTMGPQEALTIKQRLETPKEIVEAKKLIHQGNEHYRAGDFESALSLYEKAFANWPDNKQLAGQLAAMNLVHLGKNAKAVHYAKAALELDPAASEAALHAAIGLANMKRIPEAKAYFDRAISGGRPSSEALLSYAAFCEENDSFQAALTLLARHEQVYGNTLESMIAKARIYDQLGRTEEATGEYRAMLLSGFDLPADLKRYINGRMELSSR